MSNPDPVRALLAGAKANKEELAQWLADRIGDLVIDMSHAGIEIEDVPRELHTFADWMSANMELWNNDEDWDDDDEPDEEVGA